jgi:hypothetical protein
VIVLYFVCFVFRVATFAGKPGKLGKQKMIRKKSVMNQKVRESVWSGKIGFTTRSLTLTITTCLMFDYWHIPYFMDCTAHFLTFQMLVLIGGDIFFVSISKFVVKSEGIHGLWKVAMPCFVC